MKLLDPLLVDGSVLDLYLSRLAENTVQLASRLEACEKRLDLFQDEFLKLRDLSRQANKEKYGHGGIVPIIQQQLGRGESLQIERGGVKGSRVDIEGDFYGGYLKWQFEVGDRIKEGQVVAILCLPGSLDAECGAIGSPGDGILVDKLFNSGANLYGPNIVIGRMRIS